VIVSTKLIIEVEEHFYLCYERVDKGRVRETVKTEKERMKKMKKLGSVLLVLVLVLSYNLYQIAFKPF